MQERKLLKAWNARFISFCHSPLCFGTHRARFQTKIRLTARGTSHPASLLCWKEAQSSGKATQTRHYRIRVSAFFPHTLLHRSCLFPLQFTTELSQKFISILFNRDFPSYSTFGAQEGCDDIQPWKFADMGKGSLPGPESKMPYRNVPSFSKRGSYLDTNYIGGEGESPEKQMSNFFKSFQNQK